MIVRVLACVGVVAVCGIVGACTKEPARTDGRARAESSPGASLPTAANVDALPRELDAAPAAQQDGTTGEPAWRELVLGLSYAHLARRGALELGAHAFRIDLRHVRLVALDARRDARRAATARELLDESGTLAVVNGTFFDPKGDPLGLLVRDGTVLNPLRAADWGVLHVQEPGTARLVHTRDYEPGPGTEFAIQCGPRVVIDGKVPRLKPERGHRRTAVCVRSSTELVLAVVLNLVTLQEIGEVLAAPVEQGGLACRDALLLDGGPSTQLAAQISDFQLDVYGGWPVPNGLALEPRNR